MAKEYMKKNNVSYTEFNVATDLEKRKEMIDKTGQMGVPVIIVGDEVMVGFEQDKLAAALGIK